MTRHLCLPAAHGFRAALLGLVAAAAATFGCAAESGTGPGDGANAAVSVVKIAPTAAELGVGGTLQMKLTALDAAENELGDRAAVWASQDTGVASISQEVLVTARRVGVVQLQAAVEGKSAFAVVSVVAARAAAAAVAPATASVAAGGSVQLTARVTDAAGAVLPDRFVLWRSSNDAVARVSSTGFVTAVAAGTASISATSEGRSASSAVTVTGSAPTTPVYDSVKVDPADTAMVRNTTARFRARVYSRNQLVTGRTIIWSSTGSVTVSPAGDVTASGEANTDGFVIATVDGTTAGSARVRVTPKPAARVTIVASRLALPVGEEVTLSASAVDEDGVPVAAAAAATEWESSATSVLEKPRSSGSNTAVAKALAAGTARVTAVVGTARATADLTVTAPAAPVVPPARVVVSAVPGAIALGETRQLTATPVDAAGTPLAGSRAVTWTSSAPTVVSVSSAGAVTGLAEGAATITATIDGVSGNTTVQVRTPVASVAVTPPSATLTVGGPTVTLAATPRDAAGTALSGRGATSWTSSNPAVATVGTTGVVTAVGAGSATITATIEGVAGTAAITVSPPAPAPVATVTVAPATATVAIGATTTLTATLRDASGTALTGRTVVWTTSNAAVATVGAGTGVVTAVGAGTATITATSEGKSASATVTVPAPVASVLVTPATASIVAGQTTTLTAQPRDSAGAALSRPVAWTSSNQAVATVSTSGVVTAVAPGTATITATSEGKSGTATVTVPARVSRVVVSPADSSIAVGATLQYRAATLDANGQPLSGRSCTWAAPRTSGPEIASIDSTTGLARGVRAGTARIVAACEGITGETTLTVR